MERATTSRRALLRAATTAVAYATGAAIVGTGMALAGEVHAETFATPAAQVSPALAKLLADFAAADARVDRFYETTLNPAVERERVMCKAIPHVTVPLDDDPAFFSTSNARDVFTAQSLVESQPRDSKRPDVIAARKLMAAVHRRDRAFDRIARETGTTAATKREHELYVPIKEATAAIKAFPAASAADMIAKLDHLKSVGICDHDDPNELFDIVRADAARLARRA